MSYIKFSDIHLGGQRNHLTHRRKVIGDEIELMTFPDDFIKDSMTPLAIPKQKENSFYYIENGKILLAESEESEIKITEIDEKLYDFLMTKLLHRQLTDKVPNIGKSYMYTKMKVVGTWYPMFVVIGLSEGMTNILKRYKIKYQLSEKKLNKPGFVEIKFADQYFYYEDIIKNTLLLNVLYMMDPEVYRFDEFDLDRPYIEYLRDKLGQPAQYVKNTLLLNLNLYIDPITKSILHDMKYPENIIDLLLLANTMLTHNSYRAQNDVRNFRVRGMEIIYGMLYDLIAKAYLNYQRGKLNGKGSDAIELGFMLNGKKISGQKALVTKLLTSPTCNDHSILSPVQEFEGVAKVNQKGEHGINLNSAFTLELRTYSESMSGLLSGNATPFSGSAGITRSLSLDPKITNVRGYIADVDNSSLNGYQVLSPTELLSPWTSSSADPPRQAMQVAQSGHSMPVEYANPQLVGTGVNKSLAFMVSSDFTYQAKFDGYIEKIDNENEIAIVHYLNNTEDIIDLSSKMVKNSNGGFYTAAAFKLAYKENEPFKKGDILAFNPNFFSGKGKDMDYKPGALAKLAVASGDFVFEDSTLITDKLANKCKSKVIMMKQVALGPNSVIHQIKSKGDKVVTGDHLLDFTTSFNDPSTTEFLQNLAIELGTEAADVIANDAIKTKYSGLVKDIKIYYNVPFETLNESLQKLINQYNGKIQTRLNATKGIKSENVHILPIKEQTREKVGTTDYEGVLIEFYVEYEDVLKEGDKVTYTTALKGVVSKRLSEQEAPRSEYRPEDEVECILAATGIISRMTSDIYYIMASNKVLVELQKQICEIVES